MVRVAVPTPPRTLALPRSFFVLTLTRVFPAMMSFKTALTSALTSSLTRREPINGMMCRWMRPVSVTMVACLLAQTRRQAGSLCAT